MANETTAQFNARVDAMIRSGSLSAAEAQIYKDGYARSIGEPTASERASGYNAAAASDWGGMFDPATANPEQVLGQAQAVEAFGGPAPSQQQVQAGQTYQANNAMNARYGSDLSWLDPTFRSQPSFLGQSAGSQVYADQGAINAQGSTLNSMGSLYNTPMQWDTASAGRQADAYSGLAGIQGPRFNTQAAGQQQSAYNQIGNIQGPQFDAQARARQDQAYGQIAGIQGPQYEGSGRQTDVYNRAFARAGGQGQPDFLGDVDQRAVLGDMESLYASGGAQGITYDDGSRQGEQYDNLNEIIGGRGATEIEMARRQAQRADEEQWLRSQREATLEDYAERGLAGSGQELLSLGGSQQASAGRNSLADLETAATLEDRRLNAIGMAGGLATNIRGQTMDEQQFNAGRADQALYARGGMANALRQGDFNEKSYLDSSALQALGLSGQLATDIRTGTYNEETGRTNFELNRGNSLGNLASTQRGQTMQEELGRTGFELGRGTAMGNLATDMRTGTMQEELGRVGFETDRYGQMGNIAGQMRNATFNEQSFARQNQTDLLGMQGRLSTDMRNSSFDEGSYRATAADDFSVLNNAILNGANEANTNFLRNSYGSMMQERNQNDRYKLGLGVDTANTLAGMDQRNAQYDTATRNAAEDAWRQDYYGTYGTPTGGGGAYGDIAGSLGTAGTVIAGIYGGGAGAAAAGGATGGAQAETGGQTWASSVPGGTDAPLYDPKKTYY
jgi:hypothetical protein